MRVWLVSVAILFVLAEVFISIKDFILPLPIYILGGAFLAIASNYDRGIMSLFRQQSIANNDMLSQTATLIDKTEAITSEKSEQAKVPPRLPS